MEQVFLLRESEINRIVDDAVSEIYARLRPTEPEKEEKLLTTKEACEVLRCSIPTLHRWKKEGIIPHVRIGTNIRYLLSDIEKKIINERRA